MDSPEYKKLLDDTKAYFNARYDLLKLELLEKLSRIIGLVILALVVVLLVFGAFAFFGMAPTVMPMAGRPFTSPSFRRALATLQTVAEGMAKPIPSMLE